MTCPLLPDTEGVYSGVLKRIVEDLGQKYYHELALTVCGKTTEDLAKTIVEKLNLNISVEEFAKLFTKYSDEKLAGPPFMPGAERIVRHLHEKTIPIAIATSSSQRSFDMKTQPHKELFDLFHHVVCGGSDPEVKNGKPAPDIFLICASRFDDKPEPKNCLVFEDSVNGMKAGIAAGMQVVMIPDENVSQEMWKMATLRLDNLNQIHPQLFGLPPFPEASNK
ncbi:pseudouridine-5'-phosphatase-like isoform X2 [Sitophilus oryzae]|uniref:Pseudouridine-5'-phosphatase-like isoform X2 n=2 Tax=Sitophilus oryzae TaxID=7048 RepID=A0A6J2XGD6_SITOR|nr:pseudouridine-5'-phosphatase-like isoform X2 [Sitophilus oryzae]